MTLREYLTKNSFTITTFAKRLGISRQHLNNIVNGNRTPSNLLKKMIAVETQGKIREEDWG